MKCHVIFLKLLQCAAQCAAIFFRRCFMGDSTPNIHSLQSPLYERGGIPNKSESTHPPGCRLLAVLDTQADGDVEEEALQLALAKADPSHERFSGQVRKRMLAQRTRRSGWLRWHYTVDRSAFGASQKEIATSSPSTRDPVPVSPDLAAKVQGCVHSWPRCRLHINRHRVPIGSPLSFLSTDRW